MIHIYKKITNNSLVKLNISYCDILKKNINPIVFIKNNNLNKNNKNNTDNNKSSHKKNFKNNYWSEIYKLIL